MHPRWRERRPSREMNDPKGLAGIAAMYGRHRLSAADGSEGAIALRQACRRRRIRMR